MHHLVPRFLGVEDTRQWRQSPRLHEGPSESETSLSSDLLHILSTQHHRLASRAKVPHRCPPNRRTRRQLRPFRHQLQAGQMQRDNIAAEVP